MRCEGQQTRNNTTVGTLIDGVGTMTSLHLRPCIYLPAYGANSSTYLQVFIYIWTSIIIVLLACKRCMYYVRVQNICTCNLRNLDTRLEAGVHASCVDIKRSVNIFICA